MTFDIALSKLKINQYNNEIPYYSIERYCKYSNNYSIRKFYDYQNNIKNQIDLDEVCKCENYAIIHLFEIFLIVQGKKYLFKRVFDGNLEERRKYNIVLDTECYKAESYFEIRFHNDAVVPMKLLLLGGLFDAIFVLYNSMRSALSLLKSAISMREDCQSKVSSFNGSMGSSPSTLSSR